jgi:hypothetical protein
MDINQTTEIEVTSDAHLLSGYLTEAQLATELGVSQQTLRRWNRQGKGPRRRKLGGRNLYNRQEAALWIDNLGADDAQDVKRARAGVKSYKSRRGA